MRKALFLDRDGVICRVLGVGKFLTRVEEFVLMDGIRELVKAAYQKGYLLVVVTSQPQIAMGTMTADDLEKIHAHMQTELGVALDGIYVCPHGRDNTYDCRKPKPGLFHKAITELDIDPAQSLAVGDRDKDVLAAQAAGIRTVLLKSEFWPDAHTLCKPDSIVDSPVEVKTLL